MEFAALAFEHGSDMPAVEAGRARLRAEARQELTDWLEHCERVGRGDRDE